MTDYTALVWLDTEVDRRGGSGKVILRSLARHDASLLHLLHQTEGW